MNFFMGYLGALKYTHTGFNPCPVQSMRQGFVELGVIDFLHGFVTKGVG
jgi:hypothetical protein